MNIQKDRVASFHYRLKDENGMVISASPEDNPLTYIHGTGSIIPGLEKELEGRSQGEEFSVTIRPEEGYGDRDPLLVAILKKEAFQGIEDISPGMQFQAQDSSGNLQIITVTAVDGDRVTVDRNHPLAGQTLYFDVNILDVREAGENCQSRD